MKRLILMLALSGSAYSSESFSLFLTQEEQSRFNKSIGLGALANPRNSLSLKAIMMMDDDNWTFWLNDMKITPETCPDYVEILSISPAEVSLIWSKDIHPTTISLKINETVDLDMLDEKTAPEDQGL